MAQQAVAAPETGPRARPAPDRVMRSLLRVPERSGAAEERNAERLFSFSILLSATRCLLTYVVLPIVTIVLGVAATIGPYIGIPLGAVAIGYDVVAVRRFWAADHRWRWAVTAIYVLVIAFIGVLIARDVAALLH